MNASERSQTGPTRSEHVRQRRKITKNLQTFMKHKKNRGQPRSDPGPIDLKKSQEIQSFLKNGPFSEMCTNLFSAQNWSFLPEV